MGGGEEGPKVALGNEIASKENSAPSRRPWEKSDWGDDPVLFGIEAKKLA